MRGETREPFVRLTEAGDEGELLGRGEGAVAAGKPEDQVIGVRRGEFIMPERQDTTIFFFFCMEQGGITPHF